MRQPTLIGFSFGILLDIIFWFGGPYDITGPLIEFLSVISTPVAYILSWITGWPLKQEAGLMLYLYAILITIPLLGILIGITFGIVRSYMNRRR